MSTEKTSLENESQPSCLGVVTRSFLIKELTSKMAWFGIDMRLYKFESIQFSEGFGSITWLHRANDKSLPYAERRLQCNGFFYDENGLLQWNNPSF